LRTEEPPNATSLWRGKTELKANAVPGEVAIALNVTDASTNVPDGQLESEQMIPAEKSAVPATLSKPF